MTSTMSFGQQQTIEVPPFPQLDIVASRLQQHPGAIHLLYGNSSVFIVSLLAGSMLRQPLAVIDGATRFNSYTMSRIASLLKFPPTAVLRQTHVTRSFTAFQTEAAIRTKLPRFLEQTHCSTVIILGLLDTFYDEQVKHHECRQSLRRIIKTLRELAKQNIHVVIADVHVDTVPPGKEPLFPLVYRSSDIVMRLERTKFGLQCIEERRVPLWDATTTPSRLSSIETEKRGTNTAER